MFTTYTKKVALFAAFALFVCAPFFQANAEETDTLESLRAQIEELQAEIVALKANLAEAKGETEQVQKELTLTRTLLIGSEGDDVKSLQEYLAQFKDIYPEGIISGYFGELTEKAVKRYQAKHGLEQAGVVGPQTRERLRVHMAEGLTIDDLSKGLAKKVTVSDDEDEDAPVVTGNGKVSVCRNGKTLSVAVSAYKAQIRNGAKGGACTVEDGDEDEDSEDEDEDEDTDSLEIEDVDTDNIETTSADITWTTNIKADSVVWYSEDEDVLADEDAESVSDSRLEKEHELSLTDLEDGTKYYFFVVSTTEDDETATSSVESFTTDEA